MSKTADTLPGRRGDTKKLSTQKPRINKQVPWEGAPMSTDGLAGFVYCITNRINGRMYIGKKYFWSTRTKPLSSSKKRMKVTKESDWRFYLGSSTRVWEDMLTHGVENFKFSILSCWPTRGRVNEAEAQEQFTRNVLHEKQDSGEYLYYNECILSRYYREREVSEETRAKMSAAAKLRCSQPGYVYPFSAGHPNKGKKLPQMSRGDKFARWNVFTDGKTTVRLPPDEEAPVGFVRGASWKGKKKRTGIEQQRELDYLINPKLCPKCQGPITYKRRNRGKYCSKPCARADKKASSSYLYSTPFGEFTTLQAAAVACGKSVSTLWGLFNRGVHGYSKRAG